MWKTRGGNPPPTGTLAPCVNKMAFQTPTDDSINTVFKEASVKSQLYTQSIEFIAPNSAKMMSYKAYKSLYFLQHWLCIYTSQ